MTRIEINQDAIAQLQREVNAKAQDVVRAVNAEMAGRGADEVLTTLHSRMREAGMEPDDDGLRQYAEAIAGSTPTE